MTDRGHLLIITTGLAALSLPSIPQAVWIVVTGLVVAWVRMLAREDAARPVVGPEDCP